MPNDKLAESLRVRNVYHGDTDKKVKRRISMTDELEIVEQDAIPAEEPQSEAKDDMLHKSTVSKIVERERLKAFEKGKKEALMQLNQEQQSVTPQPEGRDTLQQAGSLGGMQQMTQADIERLIAERTPQALQDHVNRLQSEHTINSFVQKVQAAEARYPGLEQKLNDLDYSPDMVKLIQMANNLENTGDVMNELVDNPSKLITLLNSVEKQPKLALRQLMELGNSIKQNQDALAQEKQAQDPMSQLKPSSSAGIDNSTMSVSDFRKMFRT